MRYFGRLRARFSESFRIASKEREVGLNACSQWPELRVESYASADLSQVADVVFWTGPFDSEEIAVEQMVRLGDSLRVLFLRAGQGIDLGQSELVERQRPEVENALRDKEGRRLVDDGLGAHVYPEGDRPRYFSLGSAKVLQSSPPVMFGDRLHRVSSSPFVFDDKVRLAFDIFFAAEFESNPDVAFLIRMMALESMIDELKLPDWIQNLVARFHSEVERAFEDEVRRNQSDREQAAHLLALRNSVLGRISRMKDESISAAGRRMIRERLPGWEMDGHPAWKVFSHAYDVRSEMLHGKPTREVRKKVRDVGGTFKRMCRDLLLASAQLPSGND